MSVVFSLDDKISRIRQRVIILLESSFFKYSFICSETVVAIDASLSLETPDVNNLEKCFRNITLSSYK